MSKNKKRDLIILRKIQEYQNEIIYSLKKNKVQVNTDLSKIEYMTRRGLVQTVGDIFELTKSMTDETLGKLELNQIFIKQFRDWASHQYRNITDDVAFTSISHVISKDVVKRIKDEIENIKEELDK
ncbi:MAG: hypothetical protein FWC47_16845 [Oscillospiraceae bacterium]|nr:hypothetical protein [Oscillospiraceae bacterium]